MKNTSMTRELCFIILGETIKKLPDWELTRQQKCITIHYKYTVVWATLVLLHVFNPCSNGAHTSLYCISICDFQIMRHKIRQYHMTLILQNHRGNERSLMYRLLEGDPICFQVFQVGSSVVRSQCNQPNNDNSLMYTMSGLSFPRLRVYRVC